MNKTAMNTVLVIGATLIYFGLTEMAGRTAVNGGLGPDGPMYVAMAIDHNLQTAPAVKKLAPAFPVAIAIGNAVVGNVLTTLVLVNLAAFILLVAAACWMLDLSGAPPLVKVTTALTLCVIGHPSLTSAFDPGQPYLLGVAMLTLAVAAAEWSSGVVTAILQVGATLASPVGIVAPLYGIWKHWRARRPPAGVVVYAPALLVWLAVQYWARGGAAGLVDLVRFSRVRADAVFWTEPAFILYGLYFLVTALGGQTLLLWSNPRGMGKTVIARPEVFALVVPVIPFIATGGLDMPRFLPFLLPLWFVLVALWGRDHAARLTIPLVLAAVLTLLTQHPWARLTETKYFVDWFPYSVAAARVDISDPSFDPTWRVRMFMAAGGLAALVAWRRFLAR